MDGLISYALASDPCLCINHELLSVITFNEKSGSPNIRVSQRHNRTRPSHKGDYSTVYHIERR